MKKKNKVEASEVEANCKYVMYGFNKECKDMTAYLAVLPDNQIGEYGSYDLVDTQEEATQFDKVNVSKKRGFGTPKQWAEFFNTEETLSAWKFHPVRYLNA